MTKNGFQILPNSSPNVTLITSFLRQIICLFQILINETTSRTEQVDARGNSTLIDVTDVNCPGVHLAEKSMVSYLRSSMLMFSFW